MTRSGIFSHIYNSNKPPRTVRKPRHHWLIADWLGYVEIAPSEEDKLAFPKQKSFHTRAHLKLQHTGDENGSSPGCRPARCENSNPTG